MRYVVSSLLGTGERPAANCCWFFSCLILRQRLTLLTNEREEFLGGKPEFTLQYVKYPPPIYSLLINQEAEYSQYLIRLLYKCTHLLTFEGYQCSHATIWKRWSPKTYWTKYDGLWYRNRCRIRSLSIKTRITMQKLMANFSMMLCCWWRTWLLYCLFAGECIHLGNAAWWYIYVGLRCQARALILPSLLSLFLFHSFFPIQNINNNNIRR